MTELEQRLTKEFGKLAEQYERDQRRLAGAVERLEEQVRQLAGQYAREQTQLAGQVEALTENMQQLGSHVTILTNAYEELLKNVNEMINVSNAVVRESSPLASRREPRWQLR